MVKYTVALYLLPRSNNKGLHPVYLKMVVDGKRTLIATSIVVPKDQWDVKNAQVKNTYPSYSRLNSDLQKRKSDAIDKIVGDQIAGKPVTTERLKNHFTKGDQANIFTFVEQLKSDTAGDRSPNTIDNYKKHAKRLELYHGSKNLTFEDITPEYLQKYKNYLRGEVGVNYTHKLLVGLRTFFNAAIKKGITTNYPYDRFEMPLYVSPDKDFLTKKELAVWEVKMNDERNPVIKEAALYFLFACYSGLRVSDWYQFDLKKNYKDGRIRLRAVKNENIISMPVSAPLARMLTLMKDIPLTLEEQTINEKLKAFCKKCKIAKRITTHCGRHTFAVTVCLGNRITSETAAELMGITLKTFVDNYSQVTEEKINRETSEAWASL